MMPYKSSHVHNKTLALAGGTPTHRHYMPTSEKPPSSWFHLQQKVERIEIIFGMPTSKKPPSSWFHLQQKVGRIEIIFGINICRNLNWNLCNAIKIQTIKFYGNYFFLIDGYTWYAYMYTHIFLLLEWMTRYPKSRSCYIQTLSSIIIIF